MELNDYPVRICVAGSRSWHDRRMFDIILREYLSWAGVGPYAFISGVAWRGPDRMIIDWASENNVPCFEFEAEWEVIELWKIVAKVTESGDRRR